MPVKHRFAIAAMVVVIAAAGCNRNSVAPGAGMEFPPTAVGLAEARPAPIQDSSEYVASLKSLRSTTVQPQIDGQITQIMVKSGDRVQQGASLMQIDPRRQQAAVTSQEAERAAREADVAFAEQQYQRASSLFAAGAISKQELEQRDTALRTAQANLEALRAQLQQQQVQLRYYTVLAPTAGIIGDVPIRVGSQVTTETMLTTIDQSDTLELNVSVPVERAPELRAGLPVEILSGEGEPLASTTLSFVSPRVDDQTQSVLAKADVANSGGRLRVSQFVRARIIWKTAEGLVIPVTAVLRLNGQFFAFVAEQANGKLVARQRPITVGQIVGNNYAVLTGITPGDRVVVSGAQKLADGAPIAPQS